jgi:hypothetical protein
MNPRSTIYLALSLSMLLSCSSHSPTLPPTGHPPVVGKAFPGSDKKYPHDLLIGLAI